MLEISKQIRQLILSSDSLLITAGAGMGVDSGLPDFRGNQGLWKAYPILGRQKINFSTIANPQSFEKNPRLAWGFYGHRLDLYRKTQPHQGYNQLLKLSQQLKKPYFVVTSNVDGQFQKAGFDPLSIYECHGSIHYLQCSQPCCHTIWSADNLMIHIDTPSCQWIDELPQCSYCDTLSRPNILMFNDFSWLEQRSTQQAHRFESWLNQHHRPVVIEIGAGTIIPTIRLLSENFCPYLIRINPQESNIPYNQGISLTMTAQAGIALLIQSLS